MAGNILAGWRK